MPEEHPNLTDPSYQRQMALSRWDTEDGPSALQRGLPFGAELAEVPELTGVELLHLRIRVIALENIVISMLAQAPDRQLGFTREMAAHIFPRPGFTQHLLTVRAAHQMIDLVARAGHFRTTTYP